ncbi:MAG: hypothetical protein ABR568_03880 [Pyrinomonadaceae bacterium]
MKKIICLIVIMLFALTFIIGQAQQSLPEGKIRYPNELPHLKLYREARWKSIAPYVFREEDVEKVLGQPVLVREEDSATWVYGYDYDPDWTIVVSYVGGSDSLDPIAGRVAEITLRTRRRVSMRGVTFPSAFHRGKVIDGSRNAEFVAYQDEFGLRYLVYAKDTVDGRFRAQDLDSISYGASNEEEEKHTDPSEIKPKPNKSLNRTAR